MLQNQLQENRGARSCRGDARENLTGKLSELIKLVGEFLTQCINPFTKPIELPAGLLVEKYNLIQKKDVGAEAQRMPLWTRQESVPKYVTDLYQGICRGCGSS